LHLGPWCGFISSWNGQYGQPVAEKTAYIVAACSERTKDIKLSIARRFSLEEVMFFDIITFAGGAAKKPVLPIY
jgi:hypothetical protein